MTFKQSTLAVVITAALMGCNAEDNKELNTGNGNTYVPTAAPVKAPALYVGDIVEGIYQYTDANLPSRPEGNSKYSWKLDGAPIVATRSLEVKEEYLGKNMEFCVTPIAQGTFNTKGEEDCSEPTPVLDTQGVKPEVSNVALASEEAPVVGEDIIINWEYSHAEGIAEGNSEVTWSVNDKEVAVTTKNESSSSSTYNVPVKVNETTIEGNVIKACVQAITDSDPELSSIVKPEHCVETQVVLPAQGTAPEFKNDFVEIAGSAFVNAQLSINGEYYDAQGDAESVHQYQWFNGSDLVGEQATYQPKDTDLGGYISAKVKLCAETGEPKCSDWIDVPQMDEPIGQVDEDAPTATGLGSTITSGEDYAEVGATLVGDFTFVHASADEGVSTAYWKVIGETNNLVSCESNAHNCEVTIKAEHIGKQLDFCATPVTINGTPSEKPYCLSDASGEVTPSGVTIVGQLEYGATLQANVIGYDGLTATDGYWTVDTSIPGDSISNATPVKVNDGASYRIGVQQLASDIDVQLAYLDPKDDTGKTKTEHNIPQDGIITDHDWIAGDHDKAQDARNFIGKEVSFCLQEGLCFNASEYETVTGGVYYDSSDANVRGVEPVRIVDMTATKFHRPLTVAETKHKTVLGLTESYPEAMHSVKINGIDWALSQYNEKKVVAACRNLNAETQWYLPVSYRSDNNLAGNEDMPVSFEADLIQHVADKRVSTHNSENGSLMSPYYGWPVGDSVTETGTKISYGSASTKNKENTHFATRMYGRGLSNAGHYNSAVNAGNASDAPIFISCQAAK